MLIAILRHRCSHLNLTTLCEIPGQLTDIVRKRNVHLHLLVPFKYAILQTAHDCMRFKPPVNMAVVYIRCCDGRCLPMRGV